MGHVVNYAYRLYDREAWVKLFGPMSRPYLEEYRPQPFSRRHVRHLPGWYAQKHPDEDWAETFAVWLTPGLDWRAEYAGWPAALAKLEYCDRTAGEVRSREPLPFEAAAEGEEEEDEFAVSLAEYYGGGELAELAGLEGLDGALRAVFEDAEGDEAAAERAPASRLIRRLERALVTNVFRWTGHFPERTRPLLRLLGRRADALNQAYRVDREQRHAVALTALVTALAMNHVYRGEYFPGGEEGAAGG
jgi:hypothetical protein